MPGTAILVGQSAQLARLERQLDLLDDRPRTLGWIVVDDDARDDRILGSIRQLERIVAERAPDACIVCLPAVMTDLVASIRTKLRRLGVPDRFIPTLEDLVAGVGPRTHLDVDVSTLLERPSRVLEDATIRTVIAGRRVLLTGAGGSIGQELARIVARHGPARLVLVERSENALFEIDRQIARRHPRLDRVPVLHDVVDPDGTLEVLRRHRPEIVFHAAAHKHVPMMELHPGAAVDNNLFGTKSVVDAAAETGVERFVMISTDKAVNPSSIMGATKRLAELYVQYMNGRSPTACSMVRFGNVLGSSGSVLDVWARQIADGGPITVTDPRMTRYFMTIPEAAALVIESAALVDPAAPAGEVFLLDMGEPVRVLDLACRFVRAHGLEPVLPAPDAAVGANPAVAAGAGTMPVVYTGVRPGEKLFEELSFDAERMLPTRHPAIHVWLVPPPDHGLVRDILADLAPEHRATDAAGVSETIRRLLPEMQADATGIAGSPAPSGRSAAPPAPRMEIPPRLADPTRVMRQ